MEMGPSREANRSSAIQEIPNISRNLNEDYRLNILVP
jgi:hypothetical protein